MVAVHLVYDLTELYPIVTWKYSAVFSFVKNWGGVLFLLISGTSATLGRRSIRRGLTVFGCGLLVTAVTYAFDPDFAVTFGVLHCLGSCMVLWGFFRRLPTAALGILAPVFIADGLIFSKLSVSAPCLFWLGLTTPEFRSADFFPLLPNLGFFLLGAVIGRRLYKEKRSALPRVDEFNPLIRFFRFCGTHSLLLYLLHQPVLMLIIELAVKLG